MNVVKCLWVFYVGEVSDDDEMLLKIAFAGVSGPFSLTRSDPRYSKNGVDLSKK